MGSLHVYSSLEPKPTDASLLDSAQLLCAHFAKAVHTSFPGDDSSLQLSSVLMFTTIFIFTILFCLQKYFCIFPERQRVPKMLFSLRRKHVA